MIIEGAISVKAAIQSSKRTVEKVYIDKDKKTKDFNYIRKISHEHNIQVNELTKEELFSFLNGKSAGGICAEVSNRKSDDLDDGDIFLVDGIEDPFNLGYIARSLYALGIKNLILAKRDYESMEAQILKSSAGAFDYMNVLYSDDLEKTVKEYKDTYTIYGLKRSDNSLDIFDVKFAERALFMLGGEKRGLSSNLENLCDQYLYISYGSDFRNALNACSATAVVATLIYRQRRHD